MSVAEQVRALIAEQLQRVGKVIRYVERQIPSQV